MKHLLGLFDFGLKTIKTNASNKSEFRFTHKFNEDIYFYHQKFQNKTKENCFWEIHEEYIDVNFWIRGDETISFSEKVINFQKSFSRIEKDFWIQESPLEVVNSYKLSEESPILIVFPNTPHMCLQKNKFEFIEKLTFKIRKHEYTRILQNSNRRT